MFSKFHRGHWEQERARCRLEPPELTSREAYRLWTWLRRSAQPCEPSQPPQHQRLLADLLSRSGFDAIVEMAEEADAISEWLPQRFRTEMRISVSDLPAVELLKLVRSATGVPNLDVDADIMDVIENGCEDVRHMQRLFAEVGLGGKKVWILMESMADAEEDLYGRHHELLLKVSAGALDRRVERLQQLMNGWTQSQIQEGLGLHLTTAAEALAWCQNRLDDIHEEYAPRSGTPGISDGDWKLQLTDTAFSPKGKSWHRKKKPGLQFFPLRPSAHRFFTPSKDEGKHFWQRPEMQPTPRLDMVVRRQDVRACDVGSRVLEAKNQERETLSRCRWAEYQAERQHVTPVSKQPRFTRSRQAVSFARAKRPQSSTQRGALEDGLTQLKHAAASP
eukprot:s433_g10.t1